MIPQCYPSSINATSGLRQMRIFYLSSVTGLTRWVDYIPVKQGGSLLRANSFDTGGYIVTEVLTSTTGLQAGVDYVAVYEDSAATDAWQCSGAGYMVVSSSNGPLGLFASGEQGAWYDPSDFSSMFQDSAGTTPVTAAGQPVGKILDKSGRSNHLTQATTANRPILQQDGSGNWYLSFNGTNSTLSTPSTVDLSGTNKITLWAGVTKNSDSGTGIFAEFTASVANAGSFGLQSPGSAGDYTFALNGSALTSRSATTFTAPVSSVLSCAFDISAGVNLNILPRVNAVVPTLSSSTSSGTGNFSNSALYLGARAGASFFFNGRMYQMVLRGASSIASEVSSTERFVGSKMGISL